ncbi:AraC family transcriptional regulator [Ruegeria sp. 2205SS24-7]|uniref:helix-turn-helix transcriptional regulator n=1 Tax=Ruegeria discodermiae TaxID=3064389 RepID=UPI002741FAD9|nr:AraC family transcriptional regulator [Ruegeria sp. 2205SS24-7]MDP5218879.1 AraC family transcriptional regulator [Ruegeria sp. 2205SS24-7]
MSEAVAVHHGAFGRAALYELDRPFVTHAHREGHLIFYVDGSRAKVQVGDTLMRIDDAHAAAVSPWEPHNFDGVACDNPCLCLVMYIKPMWFLENCKTAQGVLDFGHPVVKVNDEIRLWILRLTSLLLEPEDTEAMDGYLFEMTRICYDQSWARSKSSTPLVRLKSRFSDFRVRRSLRLMQENFAEEMQMDDLARKVGLSRPHFFKLFKRQMGITPNLFLNTLRAEHAISELLTTEKTVTDIGHDLGFSSQASFTRFFASNVGIPPSEYRRVAHKT